MHALAPRTEQEYQRALARLGLAPSGFGDVDAAPTIDLSPERWEHLSNSGRLMLRAALSWAGFGELAPQIPLRHEVKRLRDFPSREEVQRFREAASIAPQPGAALLDVVLNLGLRAEETLLLERENVEQALKTGVLRLLRKGQREADLPASAAADSFRVLLKRPVQRKGVTGLGIPAEKWEVLWQAIAVTQRAAYEKLKRLVTRVAQQAQAETHWTPHMLRHAFATELVRDGAPLVVVQRALNHASFQTTAKTYIHLDTRDLEKWMGKKNET